MKQYLISEFFILLGEQNDSPTRRMELRAVFQTRVSLEEWMML